MDESPPEEKPAEVGTDWNPDFKVPELSQVQCKSTSSDVAFKTETDVVLKDMPIGNGNEPNSIIDCNKDKDTKKLQLKKEIPPSVYTSPPWAGICTEEKYGIEVLKGGKIIDKISIIGKDHYIFGRLPSCDVPLEHPSLSRYHAVIQYCDKECDERYKKGWYLFDLDSTHGTWINKRQIKPRHYCRLHVNHVIKFGGSTRLFILQGPDADQEEESPLTVTELKELKQKREREAEVLEQQKKLPGAVFPPGSEDCSWGMAEEDSDSDDELDPDRDNPFAVSTLTMADLPDPKKTLKAFFDREGFDMPEYEVQDNGRGQHVCQIQLPLEDFIGHTVTAEASIVGKKRDAVVQCALEACRILDTHGILKSSAQLRKRKNRDWEANDYYDSDEDIYLDRTGEVERKRELRKKRTGKNEPQVVHTHASLTSQLETIRSEIDDIEKRLTANIAEVAKIEESDDALEAYMQSLKQGGMDTSTRLKLKRRLVVLKTEKSKVERLLKIAEPAKLPGACGSVPLFGKKRNLPVSRPKVSATTLSSANNPDSDFEEEEEDSDNDDGNPSELIDIKNDTKTEPVQSCKEITESEPKNRKDCTQRALCGDNEGDHIKPKTNGKPVSRPLPMNITT